MKINENLVLDSRVRRTTDAATGKIPLSKDLEIGEIYTLSFDGDVKPNGNFGIWVGGGWVQIKINITLDKEDGRFLTTFKVPDWNLKKYSHISKDKIIPNILNASVWPKDPGYVLVMENIKLEKGTEATLYIPNKADIKDSSLYPSKVGGVSNGRKYVLYNLDREVVVC